MVGVIPKSACGGRCHNMKIFLVWIFLALSQSSFATAKTTTNWGVARTTDGAIAYTEHHRIEFEAEKLKSSVTTYFKEDRKTKIATLSSDYSKSQTMPTYEFQNLRSGYREGLRYSNGKYFVYNQDKGQQEKSKELKVKASIFSCQGWHYHILRNMEEFRKKDQTLNLVLPSELDYYDFTISKTREDKQLIYFDLHISNWFLRMFAPSLKLVYDKVKGRLHKYSGISNISDEKNERQDVNIEYEYGT